MQTVRTAPSDAGVLYGALHEMLRHIQEGELCNTQKETFTPMVQASKVDFY